MTLEQSAEGRPAPVVGLERIVALDTLRGIAVLGILVMNIYAFAMPFVAYSNPLLMGGTQWYNLGTWFVTHIFFDQKFMTIFSLLFGAGIVLMAERVEQRSAAFGSFFLRRQFWLLVIGAAHAYLIWVGDILFHYAVIGMIAFLFRRLAPRKLILIACLMLPIAPLLSFGSAIYMADLGERVASIEQSLGTGGTATEEQQSALDEWAEIEPFIAPGQAEVDEDLAAYLGGYRDVLAFRAPMVAVLQVDVTLFFFIWRVGGLMLLGMALMKLGILTGRRDGAFYRRLMLVGYATGLPLAALSAYLLGSHQWNGLYAFGVGGLPNYLGSILMALGHIGAVMLLINNGTCPALLARFTAVGRMALSNYLLHSLVLTTLFYGYGFSLYGSIPRAAQMLFVAAVIGLQLMLSPVWLKHFRFGPAEWLWRSLSYWRLQPMRRIEGS